LGLRCGVALSVTVAGCKKESSCRATAPTAQSTPLQAPGGNAIDAGTQRRAGRSASQSKSRMPDAATRGRIQDLLNRIQDAYFDTTNTPSVRMRGGLRTDAAGRWLKSSASIRNSS